MGMGMGTPLQSPFQSPVKISFELVNRKTVICISCLAGYLSQLLFIKSCAVHFRGTTNQQNRYRAQCNLICQSLIIFVMKLYTKLKLPFLCIPWSMQ